jgi:hypothetical protein
MSFYMQYSTISDWFNFVLTNIGIWASFSNCMHREIWNTNRVLSGLFHLVTEYTYAFISDYVAWFGIVFWIGHVVIGKEVLFLTGWIWIRDLNVLSWLVNNGHVIFWPGDKGEKIGVDYRGDTVVILYCGSIGATRYIGNVFQNTERNLMIGTVYNSYRTKHILCCETVSIPKFK